MMSSQRLGRLALRKTRVKDAARAELVESELSLVVCEKALVSADAAVHDAARALACPDGVSAGDLELRAKTVTERVARARAAATAHAAKLVEVDERRERRLDAERDVKLLRRAEERAASVEKVEADRRDARVQDDRAAVVRRSA